MSRGSSLYVASSTNLLEHCISYNKYWLLFVFAKFYSIWGTYLNCLRHYDITSYLFMMFEFINKYKWLPHIFSYAYQLLHLISISHIDILPWLIFSLFSKARNNKKYCSSNYIFASIFISKNLYPKIKCALFTYYKLFNVYDWLKIIWTHQRFGMHFIIILIAHYILIISIFSIINEKEHSKSQKIKHPKKIK